MWTITWHPGYRIFLKYKDMTVTDVWGDMFLMDYFLSDALFLSCGCQVIDKEAKGNTMNDILNTRTYWLNSEFLQSQIVAFMLSWRKIDPWFL